VVIGGVTYAQYQYASLANKYVLPDMPNTPLTVTVAKGTGADLPAEYSYIIDYIQGYILFSTPLAINNTVTVSYSYVSSWVELTDMTDWAFSVETKEVDVTSFGDEFEHYLPLQKNWSGSFSGLANITAWNLALGYTDSGQENVPSDVVYVKFYLNKNTVSGTNPYFSGACIFTKLDFKTSHAGRVECSGSFKGTGGLAKIIA